LFWVTTKLFAEKNSLKQDFLFFFFFFHSVMIAGERKGKIMDYYDFGRGGTLIP